MNYRQDIVTAPKLILPLVTVPKLILPLSEHASYS